MTQDETIRHRVAELEQRERALERAEQSAHNRHNQARRQARRAGSGPAAAPPADDEKAALRAYEYELRRDQVLRIFVRELRTIRARYDQQVERAMGAASWGPPERLRVAQVKHAQVVALARGRAQREAQLGHRVARTDVGWVDVEDALEGQIYAHATREAQPPQPAGVGGAASTPFWLRDPAADIAKASSAVQEAAQEAESTT